MIRRTLLGMFGAAPAAMVVKATPQTQTYVPEVSMNPFPDDPWKANETIDAVERAKKNLSAVMWADSNGLNTVGPDPYDTMDAEIDSMRSWSKVAKARISRNRYAEIRRKSFIDEAIKDVERQVKKSLAPEWIRRFL